MRVAMRQDLADRGAEIICRIPPSRGDKFLSAKKIAKAKFVQYSNFGVKIKLKDKSFAHVKSMDIVYLESKKKK